MLFFTLFLGLLNPALSAEPLDLNEYLKQVSKYHQGYVGSAESETSARLRINESSLIFTPQLFLSSQWATDEAQKSSAALMGTKSQLNTFQVGIQSATSIGLSWKTYYLFNDYNVQGASPQFVPSPQYSEAKPVVEVNLALWRNLFGSEWKAQESATRHSNLAIEAAEKFRQKNYFLEAEATYWRLSFLREALKTHRESVQRARKLREWNKSRVQSRLADSSELFQADSFLKAREFELQAAENESQAAISDFNALRGSSATEVPEELLSLLEWKMPLPEKQTHRREDLVSAENQNQAAKAIATAAIEKNKPTLELYASYAFNGRDVTTDSTFRKSWESTYPTSVIGIRWVAPLDFEQLRSNRAGYLSESLASDLKYQRKEIEVAKEKRDLNKKIDEIQSQLKLLDELVMVQKNKYFHEKDRQSRGRTTNFFVLQFEQDWKSAQLNFLKTKMDLILTWAKLKTFGEAP